MCYGSRIEWSLFNFFCMVAHTKTEGKRPFCSAAVIMCVRSIQDT